MRILSGLMRSTELANNSVAGRTIKALFDLKSKVVKFRFDYLAAHYYTATPQELMVILQDFSER